ncbi:hypothetical protein R6Q57_023672 [Mikania cordata]
MIKKVETQEERLSRARATIRDAGLMRRYKMPWRLRDPSFIPRGPVYRNPYAFHQLRSEASHASALICFLSCHEYLMGGQAGMLSC